MANSKGTVLLHVRTFVTTRFSEGAWRAVVASLAPADRATLQSVVGTSWYDAELQVRLFRATDQVCGRGDLAVIDALGAYEAEQDLTRIHRLFFRFANPAYVLEKAAEYWTRFHDTGRWKIERTGQTSAAGALSGFALTDVAYCVYLRAYIERLFHLAGSVESSVAHGACRSRGDHACVFSGSWR
jgi:hypothetical protein